MSIGLIGKKCGMTRLFLESGVSVPVTVVSITPNHVTQVKTLEKDGYAAIQISVDQRRASRVTKAQKGHYAKAGVVPGKGLWEFRLDAEHLQTYALGDALSVELFDDIPWVDVTGTTKGKGYAGVVKRHGFKMQDATHGNSKAHRAVGSTGQNQSPGKVFKGKKMPGQLGNVRRTVQSLSLVKVDKERNLLLIKGAVPGATGGYVMIKPAVKRSAEQTRKEA